MKIVTIILIMSLLSYNSNLETYELVCRDGKKHEYFFKPDSSGDFQCLIHWEQESLQIVEKNF